MLVYNNTEYSAPIVMLSLISTVYTNPNVQHISGNDCLLMFWWNSSYQY